MKRMSFLALILTAMLSVGGCLKQKVTLDVHPDSSGKISVRYEIVGQMAEAMLADKVKLAAMKADADLAAKSSLEEQWDGVVWTKGIMEAKEGKVVFGGDGFFMDLSKVKQNTKSKRSKQKKDAISFSHSKNPEGVSSFKIYFHDQNEDKERQKAMGKDQQNAMAKMMRGMLDKMLEGFEMRIVLNAPGKLSDPKGFKESTESSATFVIDKDAVIKGMTDPDAAPKEATCKWKSEGSWDGSAFKKEYEAAKKDWDAGSAKRAEFREKEAARKAKKLGGGFGGGRHKPAPKKDEKDDDEDM